MHKSVSLHSVSFPNDYRRQSWSALLFCLSVREGGWRGISNRLPLSHNASTLHLLAQKGTGLFFCWQISEIIVFFFSHIWALLIFGIQPSEYLSHLLTRSNFGSGICDKGELGDKIGGIHSLTLILPDSMYIWKGIHQGTNIYESKKSKIYYIWPFFATRQNNFLLADRITCRDSVYHCTIKLLQAFWFCSCSC